MMNRIKQLTLACAASTIMAGCSSTSGECSKPGAALNQVKAQVFFIENAKREGVKKSPHGYQYKVIKKGRGTRHPESGDKVLVYYQTRKLDGTLVDATQPNAPMEMNVKDVIKGWQLALADMVEGDKFTLYVPADLAYGCKANPPAFGYDEALEFDIELLKIK
ncbi:FKBP-type peptidyl-prolyl cis-trans isomerase [Neptunicella marina]|uniref:Peptidyl-prolyl cis-trans isomerase n=1 Tax=Neptunicella marina TaxID=2125989 RepID=A0A8J6M3J0_9ALTE|nr:FKBP-type peptidyl-prolyl cis-trans isomerase [Neptunicella marina]MBC3767092.1 FKBP-type peptidyl-prolyl cis-trans isomerase [Neptunicella marina]